MLEIRSFLFSHYALLLGLFFSLSALFESAVTTATMFHLSFVLVLVTIVSRALGQSTIQILAIQDLSLPDTFVFKPNSLTANVGDTLEFHFAPTGFLPSNHSVAQGTFDTGCEPMDNGFFSGNVTADPEAPLGEAVGGMAERFPARAH